MDVFVWLKANMPTMPDGYCVPESKIICSSGKAANAGGLQLQD
jgi:hypothetical protein